MCEHCSKEFMSKDSRKRFCNGSCSASFNNKGISRNRKRPFELVKCRNCDSSIDKRTNTYCNSKCFGEYKNKQLIQKWINDPLSVYTADGLPSSIREYLIKQANYTCSECPWDKFHPTTGKSLLHIDHINGDAMDNRPENLRVVCPNCHSLSLYSGSLNAGNGKRKRSSK